MSYQIIPEKGALIAAAQQFIDACATKAVNDHGAFYLAVSGGSLAGILGQMHFQSMAKWHLFLVDERAVPKTHSDSNYRSILDAWPQSNEAVWHPVSTDEISDLDILAESYSNEIEATLHGRPFDLLILGLGPDGHTASLFPNHPDFVNNIGTIHTVIPVRNSPKPPSSRVSLSPAVIQAARSALFIICDAPGKIQTVREIVNNKNLNFPPTMVAPNAHWIIDVPLD